MKHPAGTPTVRIPKLLVAAALAVAAGRTSAGGGAAELTLDRWAVRELIALALPPRLALDLPVVGRLAVVLRPPTTVAFAEGSIEAAVPVELPDVGWSEIVDVRYVPEVERTSGTVRLVAASAVPRSTGPGWLDLAGWLEPIDLPRRFDWRLTLDEDGSSDVTAFVQRVTVTSDRLRIELGLSLR
jgi:hypothetical protein